MDNSEFKKGDFITGTLGLEKRVFEIILKPKFKSRVLYVTILIDGVRREVLAQWYRLATPSEIKNGVREDEN